MNFKGQNLDKMSTATVSQKPMAANVQGCSKIFIITLYYHEVDKERNIFQLRFLPFAGFNWAQTDKVKVR